MKILTARQFAALTKEELSRCQNTMYELDPYEGEQVRCECVGVLNLKVDTRGSEWKLKWETVDVTGWSCRVDPDEPLNKVYSSDDLLTTVQLLSVEEFEAYKVEQTKREAAWTRQLARWDLEEKKAAEARKVARKARREKNKAS